MHTKLKVATMKKLDFHTKAEEIVLVLEQAFETAKINEANVKGQVNAGANVTFQQVGAATFNRLDIEIQLLRARKSLDLK